MSLHFHPLPALSSPLSPSTGTTTWSPSQCQCWPGLLSVMLDTLGLDSGMYSLHSLCRGCSTAAYREGLDQVDIKRHGCGPVMVFGKMSLPTASLLLLRQLDLWQQCKQLLHTTRISSRVHPYHRDCSHVFLCTLLLNVHCHHLACLPPDQRVQMLPGKE